MSTSTAGRAAGEPRTAFVLAGGAAVGAMQAGMIHALYERGIAPDLLIGTSAGALNAAFPASRPATVATAHELAALWRGLRRSDILPLRPATLLGGLAGRRDHLIPDQALAAAREALTVGSAQPADGGHSPCRDVARPDRAARRPLWRRPRARPGAFRATAARGSRRRPGCCGAGAGGVLPGWRASRPSRSSGQTGDASAGHRRAPSARSMADIGHAGIPEASGAPLMPRGRTPGREPGLIPIDGGHRRQQP